MAGQLVYTVGMLLMAMTRNKFCVILFSASAGTYVTVTSALSRPQLKATSGYVMTGRMLFFRNHVLNLIHHAFLPCCSLPLFRLGKTNFLLVVLERFYTNLGILYSFRRSSQSPTGASQQPAESRCGAWERTWLPSAAWSSWLSSSCRASMVHWSM